MPNPPERRVFRRRERIYEPFLVTIRNVDSSGEPFESHTILDNFSATGFYGWLERRIKPGTKLCAIVHASTSSRKVPAPRVVVRGVVLPAEPQPDAMWGIAVRFSRHRFL
jgi:hypothetical protein